MGSHLIFMYRLVVLLSLAFGVPVKDLVLQSKISASTKSKRLYWKNAYKDPITFMFIETESIPEKWSKLIRHLRTTTYDALKMWEKSSALRFIEVTDAEKAEIKISFENETHDCDGVQTSFGQGVLAHAYYPGTRHRNDIAGDIHINNVINWEFDVENVEKYSSSYHLFSVLVHELGHSLGLDHVSDNSAIMFPSTSSIGVVSDPKQDLPEVDRMNVMKLYDEPVFSKIWTAVIIIFAVLTALIAVYLLIKYKTEFGKTLQEESRSRPKLIKAQMT